ncbi:MAG: pkd domain containing protein [Candidatus Gottesmanbacteria bacterium GW2011_GWB1_49_7]|uniref:Pkd domain containing protein n=1 Tax=Candidatus Gottesmanbacteria bacterium GW2011_GWB1_49_7 TaxID=1618448 RepID=A0A0G1Y6R8_9BACT|nr:MAG: pkd domain containing protein [Candidatus Gottesmanbacteria bacterium GW2011_GWB1_49_7]
MRNSKALAGILLVGLAIISCSNPVTDTPKKSTSKTISTFSFSGLSISGTINESTHSISFIVPTTNIQALVPTIVHSGMTVSPAAGSAQNFSTPIVYRVTAEDGSTQDYTVTVSVQDILISGSWNVQWSWQTSGQYIIMKYTNKNEYAYASVSDYANNLTLEECNIISYDNSTKTFVKYITKHPSVAWQNVYQKSSWVLGSTSIHIDTKVQNADQATATAETTFNDSCDGTVYAP